MNAAKAIAAADNLAAAIADLFSSSGQSRNDKNAPPAPGGPRQTTTTTEAKMKMLTITLSDARPVKINEEEWPTIAAVSDWSGGAIECQANTEWEMRVRRHADGRTIVYGRQFAGNGGQYAGTRNPVAGYLLTAEVGEEEVVRSIRRVAGAIGRNDLGSDCIADLPAEVLS